MDVEIFNLFFAQVAACHTQVTAMSFNKFASNTTLAFALKGNTPCQEFFKSRTRT